MRRVTALLAVLLAAPAGLGPGLRAQSVPETAVFVVRLGTDTLAVERFTRTPVRLEGEVVTRSPRTSYRRYAEEFGLSGSVTRAELVQPRLGAAADAPPVQSAVATFGGDSIHLEVRRGDSTQATAVATGIGVIPLVSGAYGPFELLTIRARQARRGRMTVPTYAIGGRATSEIRVSRLGRDSVLLVTPTTTFRARVDEEGRILGLRAPGSTQQVEVERVAAADLGSIAAAWAARDAQGLAMGTLSPRDTVRASVGGATVLIDYGRPRRRGREIFGNVVPWGRVWRTGANAATQLRTDRNLRFGRTTIPAGTYTLWTLPTPRGWRLIVNRQTGQWGTDYDPDQDLARIPMTVAGLAEPVDTFTIAVEPGGNGGTLSLSWDRTRAQVPFTVR